RTPADDPVLDGSKAVAERGEDADAGDGTAARGHVRLSPMVRGLRVRGAPQNARGRNAAPGLFRSGRRGPKVSSPARHARPAARRGTGRRHALTWALM